MKSQFIRIAAMALFVLLAGSLTAVLAQESTATVMLGGNDALGAFLVGPDGMTLYRFANDAPGVSNCYEQCALNWPPLLVEENERPTLAEGIPGRLGVIARTDGTRQVIYNGWPLYYWVNDAAPGDATGHLVGNVWFVVTPPTVGLGGNADLGAFLVGSNGMTLYTFGNDAPGVSNCYDQCALNWPPLLVESEEALTVQPGLVGEFSVLERTDGTLQVAYNGWPLYFWINDMAPGDATGHRVRDVWFVAKPATLSIGGNADLGEFLVGPDGMTLYTFGNDTPGVSNCYDQCAVNWPPLLVAPGEEPSAGEGVTGELGTIERTDGGIQVTYNGQPLYYWINDVIPGDATGHLFRDVWFVVAVGDDM